MKTYENKNMTYIYRSARVGKKLWFSIFIALISILLSACSSKPDDMNKADEMNDKTAEVNKTVENANIIQEKSLLMQAVDWCNDNLFEEKQPYEIFTIENRTGKDKEYDFLIRQEADKSVCELYYIQYEDGRIKQAVNCGAGEKSLFSYELVQIHGEDFAAVYCANENLEGDLKLYSLNDFSTVYTIDDAIDYNKEAVTVDDDYIVVHTLSSFYSGGKLKAEFKDLNHDKFTDICLTGYIYEYIKYPWDEYLMLTNILECKREYYFDKVAMQFYRVLDSQQNVYARYPSAYDYVGYLDRHPALAKNNPPYDYDGDGLLDRIYKEKKADSDESSFFVHFGNGKSLLLTDHTYGFTYTTMAADLTGDGVNEIIFEQYSHSTKDGNLFYTIAAYKDGDYEIVNIPYFYSDYSEIDGLLYLPLIMNKVNDKLVSIYQPDSGYRSYISTAVYSFSDDETFNEMEHLYSDYNEKNKLGYYKASEMRLIETGKSGKKALLLRSYLGDKWCSKSLDWKLEFVSGEWKITGVYQADPIRIEIGTKLSADLDGDKKEDTLFYSTHTVTENGSKLELPVLNINGKEYDNEYLKEKLGVDIVNASPACYYIIDLDVTDNYREFAILDEGNGSRLTHFFRYSAGELKYCGSVSAFPDDDCFFSNGYGKLEARKPLDILENWWTHANWIINDDGILEEEKENLYYNLWHESDPYAIYYAKEDINIYKSNDKNSEIFTIKAGTRLCLTATDNKNWIVLEPKSQTGINLDEGWIYIEDGKVITPYGDVELEDLIG